jgi:PAS domain S-box-containing protein
VNLEFQFIDHIKHSIQVADRNGDIVFFNRVAKERLGIDEHTEKQYHVRDFQPFFTDQEVWEKHFEELKEKKEYIVRSTHRHVSNPEFSIPVEVTANYVVIEGEEYIVAMSQDITPILDYEKKLSRKDDLLRALSNVTMNMLDSADLMTDISDALPIVGQAAEVDRTYLFINERSASGEMLTSQKAEWNSGEEKPQIDNPELQSVPLEIFDDFLPTVLKGAPFEAIVEEMKDSALKEILEAQSIVSILIIPVFLKGTFWGFIGYDECKEKRIWEKDEVSLLRAFATVISKALERNQQLLEIERYAQLTAKNPQPVFKVGTDGSILLANRASQELQRIAVFGHPQRNLSLDDFARFLYESMTEVETASDYQITTQGGRQYNVTAIRNPATGAINVYLSEVTDLIALQKDLTEAKYLNENILANLDDAVWSVGLPNYDVLFLSNAIETFTGMPRDVFYANYKSWTLALPPEERWVINHMNRGLLEKGEVQLEHRMQPKNGPEIWVSNRAKVILNERGAPIRIDGVLSNITQRKMRENALKLQDERFRMLTKNAQLGIVEVDNAHEVIFTNEIFEQMSGYSVQSLMGQRIEQFARLLHSSDLFDWYAHAINDIFNHEIAVSTASEVQCWWLVSATKNYDLSGKPKGYILSFLDISVQKITEFELRDSKLQAEEALNVKENFLANMSHEIRTPLNGIIGLLEQLNDQNLPATAKELTKLMQTSSHHLKSIVDQILDLSRVTSGTVVLNPSDFRWSELMEEIEVMTVPLFEEKMLDFSFRADLEGYETFYGDAVRIKQVLLNLLSNSIKYTEQGGVAIHAQIKKLSERNCEISVVVKDTGIGMSPDFQKKVFDKFSREHATGPSDGSIGLGMSISYEIVQLMHGSLTIESTQHEGTAVQVVFPLQWVDQAPPTVVRDSSIAVTPNGFQRVLFVEDNRINRMILEMILKKNKVDFAIANDGEEALSQYRSFQPEVILMDIHMPLLSGIDATQIIRKEQAAPLKIYALTANVTSHHEGDYQELGFDGLITKPFEEQQILNAIARS